MVEFQRGSVRLWADKQNFEDYFLELVPSFLLAHFLWSTEEMAKWPKMILASLNCGLL